MKIFCIGDLHLSGQPMKKPMDIFGVQWTNHPEKIKENWLATVGQDDLVLLCGDTSWGMNLQEADEDLQWIMALPGRKILVRGNHDYWWTSVSKMRSVYPELEFLQNDCVLLGKLGICGCRGWKVPSNEDFSPEDEKIYKREAIRMKLSLDTAIKQGAEEIIMVLHFPPIFKANEQNFFTDLFEQYPVKHIVFGHIHSENNIAVFEGMRNEINFKLCSSNTQNFTPVFVKEI